MKTADKVKYFLDGALQAGLVATVCFSIAAAAWLIIGKPGTSFEIGDQLCYQNSYAEKWEAKVVGHYTVVEVGNRKMLLKNSATNRIYEHYISSDYKKCNELPK